MKNLRQSAKKKGGVKLHRKAPIGKTAAIIERLEAEIAKLEEFMSDRFVFQELCEVAKGDRGLG